MFMIFFNIMMSIFCKTERVDPDSRGAVDPHSLYADPDQAVFLIRIQVQV